ncbi:STE family protein kinase, partial [Planoprotostelium fungivorum]
KYGTVAVKIQTPEGKEQANAIMQEIDLHEHMCSQSPKVVQLYRKLIAEPEYHMIMERMTCSLACMVMPLTEEETATVMSDTLEALNVIHIEGVAHRDIKPDNLMLSMEGDVKICDFGLSAFDGDEAQLAGTLVYLPPEVAEEYLFHQNDPTLRAGFAMDLWALGITAYEFVCARVPFEDPDLHVMTEWIYNSPAPRLPTEGKFSEELRDFIAQCLTKDPANRPKTADMLLHPFLDHEKVAAGRISLKNRADVYRSTVRR